MQNGYLDDAIICPSPNFDARPEGVEVNLIVIHNISLPPAVFGAEDIIAFFQNRLDIQKHPFYHTLQDKKVSAHFLIARSGTLYQFVSLLDRAWHAGVSMFQGKENCNDYSVGIELEGTDTMVFTASQYTRLAQLTQTICAIFPAITNNRIVGHSDIALPKGRKTDPGPYFDWEQYLG